MTMDEVKNFYSKIKEELSKYLFGKEEEIKLLTIALLSEGHVLIEGYPGIAKTLLAKTFALSLGLKFSRIQFTPDLLPTDILGTYIFDLKTQSFVFMEGPIFSNIVLGDEINRASPKTQSALLEAMQERQVTISGVTRILEKPFLVIATQNPIELEGTYPLPEAQLDRFMFRIITSYPDFENERAIVRKYGKSLDIKPNLVANKEEILSLIQKINDNVYVNTDVEKYMIELIYKTRNDKRILLGASPRATVFLYRACKSLAAIKGRNYVIPDDVKEIIFYVLNHRIILSLEYTSSIGINNPLSKYSAIEKIINEYIISTIPPR